MNGLDDIDFLVANRSKTEQTEQRLFKYPSL